ncbi:MAG: YdeI/OmpD-associated family protein [Sphaerospermopsis kisseleviana]
MNSPRVTFVAELERKHPKLPVYFVVPNVKAQALRLCATEIVEGTVNGNLIGRRSIKKWDAEERSPWFVEFTSPFCQKAGIKVGDKLNVSLWLASTALPVELEHALQASPVLQAKWNGLTDYSRRTSTEHVHAAKSPTTRARRVAAIIANLT